MALQWLIKKDSDAAVTLADAGVTSCVLTLRANGVDSLDFTQGEDWLASPAWPFGSKVTLISRAGQTDTIRFVGTVESIPRQASGGGPQAIRYTALNAAHALMLCDYSQEWHYTNSSGVDSVITEPTVVLGDDNSGVRLASGGVIAHVAAYAVARGVPMAVGTVAAGVTVPLDERDNIRCWDAIVAMLRYTPDYVLWFDYSSGTPTLNVTAPASMSTLTRDVQDAAEAAFTPRLDLQVPGILCTFRWRGDYDGREVKYRDTQTAGNSTHPRRVSLVYDLDGVHAVFISQQVEVEDYPADWTSSAGKTALKARLPQLAQLADADWSVVSVTRSGSLDLPARLVSGTVPEWTDKDSESETFTATIQYTAKSTDTSHVLDAGRKKLAFTVVSTDATSTTYRKMTEWVEPETVPSGMAAALYASWNRLHYDGRVEFRAQDCDLALRPGALLSCTGGLTEWASMAAVIQDVSHDLATGSTVVSTGACGRLEADNLMAVYRAARGRRYAYRRIGRDDPDAGGGSAIDAGGLAPNDGADGGAPPILRTRLGVEASDGSRTHLVDIHPAAIAFQDSGNAAALNIAVKEVLLPVEADGKVTGAKRAQVLACTPYGDEIPLDVPEDEEHPNPGEGGSIPELPEPPGPIEIEYIEWVGGEPIIDLNSGEQQEAPVRLRAVLPFEAQTFWPCKFVAARFPDVGDEDESLGIVRGLDTDETHKLKARLAGVNDTPASSTAQRVYGYASTGEWGLYELESLFKFDTANKRFYIDLAGYTNFKSLSDDATAFDFNSDANLDGKNGATFDVVTDVAWDSTNNKLVCKKRSVTLFKFGLKSIGAASSSDVIVGEECE